MSTGDRSAATVSGRDSIACALGVGGRARGVKDCWIVLTEWHEAKNIWLLSKVVSVRVDGEKIKENVFYQLKDGLVSEITERDKNG